MSNTTLPKVGQRVEATQLISYTVEEFDDYPLVLQPGERGTIAKYDPKEKRTWIDWDNDQFKHMAKSVGINKEPNTWPIRIIS